MGFWGAVVGGVFGGLVGGPVGAAMGAAMGAAVDGGADDSGASSALDELPMELQWNDDEDGRLLLIVPQFDLTHVVGFRLDMLDASTDELLRGVVPFTDQDGHFAASTIVTDDGHVIACYIPFGFAVRTGRPAITRVLTIGETGVLGASHFELDWPHRTPSRVRLLRPLVAAAMRVARADGSLAREEVAQVRERIVSSFELDGAEREVLRDLMKLPDSRSMRELAEQVQLRLPDLNVVDVIGFLAQVAHADGSVHSAEVACIREFAVACGATEDEWGQVQEQFGLRTSERRLSELLAVFGLSPGASEPEIKAAYRNKMRDYHPDTVAHLAPEFQEVAVRKSQELNDAYGALRGLMRG